jgi:flagellar basal-body rod protein FlgB
MNIFGPLAILERVLDVRATRHQVIASNIANEETPGYRAKDLRFKEALAAASRSPGSLSITHARHINATGIEGRMETQIKEIPTADLPLDANSVNIDLAMAKLADNAMQYNTAAELVARRFRGLLNVIREGR